MRYLPLILLLFTIPGYSQTCVIAKKTKDAIYVGADRMVSIKTIYPNGDTTLSFSYTKKIFRAGIVNYALIGKFYPEINNVLNPLVNKKSSLFSLDSAYIDLILNDINLYIRDLKHRNHAAFKDFIPNEPFSQIVFFGKDADSLFIYAIRCYFDFKINAVNLIRTVRTDLYYGGEVKQISDTLEKKSVWGRGIASTIRSLIDTSSKYNPNHVGGSTDILKVTSKGYSWVKNPVPGRKK